MHQLKKNLAATLLIGCMWTAALATPSKSLDVSALTPEQRATLALSIEQLKKENPSQDAANISATVRTEASAWADLGTNVGRAAVSAAKELGVAANDFVQTPLGKVTMAIVIYKVVGSALLHLFLGLFVILVTLGIGLYLTFRKKYLTVEYESVPRVFGRGTVRKIKSFTVDKDLTNSSYGAAGLCSGIGLVIGLVIIFTA